jgi:hypothetical protein
MAFKIQGRISPRVVGGKLYKLLWKVLLNSLLKQAVLIVYFNHGLNIPKGYWGERAAHGTHRVAIADF